MTAGISPEQRGTAIRALRYTLAVLDETHRQAAGGDPADAPAGIPMTVDEAIALAPVLAMLVAAEARAVALHLQPTDDPAELDRNTREHLLQQLEAQEIAAAEADMEDGDGEPGEAARP